MSSLDPDSVFEPERPLSAAPLPASGGAAAETRSLIAVRGIERFSIVDGIESESLYRDNERPPDAFLAARRQESIHLFYTVLASLPEQLPEVRPDQEASFRLAQTIGVDRPGTRRSSS